MPIASAAGTSLVAAIHVYITYLEMVLWSTPRGHRTFGLTPQFAEQTRRLGANQGLYNGFLAAGLAWGVLHPVPAFGRQIRLFFLGCVVVAGAFGGATVGRRVLLVQALPAAAAAALVLAEL